jgi:predicted O-methyltransferase YrrM
MFREARRFKEFYFGNQLRAIMPLLLQTGETHNFTYDLTDANLLYLAEIISVATDRSASEIEGYIQEAINDRELRDYFDGRIKTSDQRSPEKVISPFGRRLGWYAIVRAIKPQVVVETGVERGHGALLLCAALLRNREDGIEGRYFGTDIDSGAGWLLSGKYAQVGKILVGDSLTSLRSMNETIDLFINDSDHSADYEAEEYRAIASKLSPHAIVLGDNAHVTDKLAKFSRETGRSFLMFKEQPRDHWYPGAGIGISFPSTGKAQQP